MSVPAAGGAIHAIAACLAACLLSVNTPAIAQPESFDELYARGQKANAAITTLTARFTETTTSSLLTKPIVARGRLAVERPSRVVMRYADPDARVVLIDGNKMTMSWPARHVTQVTDIATAQGRVQKYFVNGTAAELRNQFEIDDHGMAGDRRDLYFVTMVPKRKQIRASLAQLDLWVSRSSLLLSAMKMTFANGDTKALLFEDIAPNATLEPGSFTLAR